MSLTNTLRKALPDLPKKLAQAARYALDHPDKMALNSMADSGTVLCARMSEFPVPVVFTGAMVPYAIKGSDAVQNVTEALLALRLLPPGAYVVLHNRILTLPGVQKDHKSLTFQEN